MRLAFCRRWAVPAASVSARTGGGATAAASSRSKPTQTTWQRTALAADGVVADRTVVETALAAAPAIATVVGAAAMTSVLQLWHVFTDGGSNIGSEDGFFGSRRWQGRTLGIIFVWVIFVSYALFLAPGKTPDAQAADATLLTQLLSTPFDGTVSALFVCIFNSLGIWPVIYAATLLPGAAKQSPVPAWPFVVASFALGAFGLSPYLALREYRGTKGSVVLDDVDFVTRNWLEGRINAVLLLAGAVYLALYALGNGTIGDVAPVAAWSAFLPVFMGSLTPHISCVDFLVLWMFYSPVLLEDGRRRGIFTGPLSSWDISDKALFMLCAGLPVFGGCAWLLLRPPLSPADAAQMPGQP